MREKSHLDQDPFISKSGNSKDDSQLVPIVHIWYALLSQLLVILYGILLVLSHRSPSDVLTSDGPLNVPHIVELCFGQLPALTNHHLVSTLAEVVFIVHMEIPTVLKPSAHFCVESVS